MAQSQRTFRTQAIILKRRDFGEADRLLTLLTPGHGKMEALAKGARKPTSKATGHVELFTRADALIARGRTFNIVQQAEQVAPYLPLREELERGAYAAYVAELLDRFTGDDDADEGALFTLLDDTLERLCTASDVRLPARYFEMRLLDEVGFRPELNLCVISQQPIIAQDQFFSFAEGGVVSPDAAQHTGELVTVSMPTLKIMRHLQRSTYPHVASLVLDEGRHRDLERVMLGYLSYLLERRLQSVAFIRHLRRYTP